MAQTPLTLPKSFTSGSANTSSLSSSYPASNYHAFSSHSVCIGKNASSEDDDEIVIAAGNGSNVVRFKVDGKIIHNGVIVFDAGLWLEDE